MKVQMATSYVKHDDILNQISDDFPAGNPDDSVNDDLMTTQIAAYLTIRMTALSHQGYHLGRRMLSSGFSYVLSPGF
jgi:hypothetical protein